jgi:hypothetical protein
MPRAQWHKSSVKMTSRSIPANRNANRKDVPKAEVHVLEARHFALDTAADRSRDWFDLRRPFTLQFTFNKAWSRTGKTA